MLSAKHSMCLPCFGWASVGILFVCHEMVVGFLCVARSPLEPNLLMPEAWHFGRRSSKLGASRASACCRALRRQNVSLFWRWLPLEQTFGAFCLDVRTLTVCRTMGFPLNHEKLRFQQGSRKQPRDYFAILCFRAC